MNKSNILDTIVEKKKQEVLLAKKKISLKQLATFKNDIRDFTQAIKDKISNQTPAVIAEIKKASPSKGIIREDFNPIVFAKSYAEANATCLSILTDESFFHGKNLYLSSVKSECSLPILRKDFIIDKYQVYESAALGADCILLIVACLNDDQLHQFHDIALSLGLSVLVESHNEQELKRAMQLSTPLMGINNRDLKTFKTTIQNSIQLSKKIQADKILITESGIKTQQDVRLLREHGINAFLIGETFMRYPNPGQGIHDLFR